MPNPYRPAARNRFLHFKCLPPGRHEKRRAGAICPCSDDALRRNAAHLRRDRSHGRAPAARPGDEVGPGRPPARDGARGLGPPRSLKRETRRPPGLNNRGGPALDAGVAEPQDRDGPTRLTRVGLGGDRVVRDLIALSAQRPRRAASRRRVDARPVGSPGWGASHSLSTRGGFEQAVAEFDWVSTLRSAKACAPPWAVPAASRRPRQVLPTVTPLKTRERPGRIFRAQLLPARSALKHAGPVPAGRLR
jgi:hypothetical protein